MEFGAFIVAGPDDGCKLLIMLRRNFGEGLDQDAPLVRIENEKPFRIDRAPIGRIRLGLVSRVGYRSVFRWRCAVWSVCRCCQGEGGSGERKSGKLHFSYFSRRARFTSGVTNGVISPPRLAISFTSREATA